jgi:glutamate racemase
MFDILGIEPRTIVEMVGPAVESFKGKEDKHVLIAATPATIASGIYRLQFEQLGMRIIEVPIAALALAIEQDRPRAELDRIVEDALAPVPATFDTVLLACTHYPLARESFERALYRRGSEAEIVDPALAVARRAVSSLALSPAGTDGAAAAPIRFIISADSQAFRTRVASLFAGDSYTIEVMGQEQEPPAEDHGLPPAIQG